MPEREEIENIEGEFSGFMSSKTGKLDDELFDKLEDALHKPSAMVRLHDVAKIASEHSAIDLAYAASRLPVSARPILFENLANLEAKTLFMVNTSKNTRSVIFRILEDDEIAELINFAPPDEGVWMLEDLPQRRVLRILHLLDETKAEHITELQSHRPNTAGRLMSNEFFAFEMNTTIGEAAARIRDNPGIDLTRRIFVLNEQGELQGYVPARNLIINPPFVPIKQVMRSVSHTVSPETTRDVVVDMVERYKIPALPVVNQQHFLLGVISYEDVVEAIEEMADEAFALVAGTVEDLGEDEVNLKRYFARAPWLIVTLFAGFLSMSAMSYAESFSEPWFISFLFVVPLVTGMSGNVGVQCSTLLIRSIATGGLPPGRRFDAVFKELGLGLAIGLSFGILGGVLVYTLNVLGVHEEGPSSLLVAFIVSSGIFATCLTATLLGTASPIFFARLGIDPAVAAGPIVTAFNDVISTMIYLVIAYNVSLLFI